jgi:uncharacterized protein YxjI
MRYRVREKLLSLGDDFTVYDEDGNRALYVDGHFVGLTEKLSLYDGDGNKVGLLRKRMVSLRKVYDLYRDGTLFATISKDLLALFRDSFTVDVPGPNDYAVTGSFLDHEYAFHRRGKQVAQVSKAWFTLTDSYGVEVDDDEDEITILVTVIIIDQILHDGDAGV